MAEKAASPTTAPSPAPEAPASSSPQQQSPGSPGNTGSAGPQAPEQLATSPAQRTPSRKGSGPGSPATDPGPGEGLSSLVEVDDLVRPSCCFQHRPRLIQFLNQWDDHDSAFGDAVYELPSPSLLLMLFLPDPLTHPSSGRATRHPWPRVW